MAGGATRKSNRRVKAPQQSTSNAYDPFRDFDGGPVELFLHKVFYHVRTNLKLVLAAVSLAVIALIGAVSYRFYTESQERKAREAFDELVGDPRLGENVESTAPGARLLQEYRKNHTTEGAQRRALIYELDLFRQAGEYEKAGDVANELAESLEMPELRAFYYYQSAVYYEKAESYEKSAAGFEQMLTYAGDDPFMKALGLFGKGRALTLKGDQQQADQAFGDLWAIEQQDQIQDIRAAAAAFLIAR
ncbi:MAG TPA: hypothetical protein DEA96_10450 [Leptospiraceae bacterium]|nr:hypothetical protein [Spirochaetaceae bacterium]HBS05377.1 hypothetical protein [Leptospiraceae bacterium]|tara:strand:+ start:4670 stop:5410 length:741 start_codon:yes stop_codon:yes gene_type:complete